MNRSIIVVLCVDTLCFEKVTFGDAYGYSCLCMYILVSLSVMNTARIGFNFTKTCRISGQLRLLAGQHHYVA